MLLVPGFAENTNPGNNSQLSGTLLLPQFTFNHNPGNGNHEEATVRCPQPFFNAIKDAIKEKKGLL